MKKLEYTAENAINMLKAYPLDVQGVFWYSRQGLRALGIVNEIDKLDLHEIDILADELGVRYSSLTNASVGDLLTHVNKNMRLEVLYLLANTLEIPRMELSGLIIGAWVSAEFSNLESSNAVVRAWVSKKFPNRKGLSKWPSLFKMANKKHLMTDDDALVYGGLPDVVTMYRGVPDKLGIVEGMSWTIDYDVGNWFARRWECNGGEVGALYVARIAKKDIYCFTNARKESEVIVNPDKLMTVERMVM